jgi:hypothetical protein
MGEVAKARRRGCTAGVSYPVRKRRAVQITRPCETRVGLINLCSVSQPIRNARDAGSECTADVSYPVRKRRAVRITRPCETRVGLINLRSVSQPIRSARDAGSECTVTVSYTVRKRGTGAFEVHVRDRANRTSRRDRSPETGRRCVREVRRPQLALFSRACHVGGCERTKTRVHSGRFVPGTKSQGWQIWVTRT